MNQEKFEQWCLVELFGHSKIAGLVTEQTIGGQSFVRVDVPDTSRAKAFTRLLGSGAIYAINPCSEELARSLADSYDVKPIAEYQLPDDLQAKIRAGEQLLSAKSITLNESRSQIVVDDDDDQDFDDGPGF